MQSKINNFLENKHFFDYLTVVDYLKKLDTQTNAALSKQNFKQIHFPRQLERRKPLRENIEFISMDLGGTYLRLYLCHQQAGNIEISKEYKQSFFEDKLYTPETLFTDLKKHLDRFLSNVKNPPATLIFSFANALRPGFRNGRLDGEILYWGKNHRQQNLLGLCLGQDLEDFLHQNGYPKINLSVINDNALALLSTDTSKQNSTSTIVNLIIGSGTNISAGYNTQKGYKIVNLEFGDFDFVPYSDFDRQLNYISTIPNKFLTEKLFAGAWQHLLFRIILKRALAGKIIPAEPQFGEFETMTAVELEQFFRIKKPDFPSFEMLREIWTAITVRGAFICALGLHSIINYLTANHLLETSITISESGAVLKNSPVFRQALENNLINMLKNDKKTAKLAVELTCTPDPICPGVPKLLFLCSQRDN